MHKPPGPTLTSIPLEVLPGEFAIARLGPRDRIPGWAQGLDWVSITRTSEELSIVCPAERVPEDVEAVRSWACLKVKGPLDFSLTGIISSLTAPLAATGISVFVMATYLTDYLLVSTDRLEQTIAVLRAQGHTVD